MLRRLGLWIVVWSLIGLGVFWVRGCDTPLDPIVVADGTITVRNQTGQEWRDVRIWVNEYYAASLQAIPVAGFVREPINRFVAAQGQTINAASTPITSVVVLATDATGARVRLVWGTPTLH